MTEPSHESPGQAGGDRQGPRRGASPAGSSGDRLRRAMEETVAIEWAAASSERLWRVGLGLAVAVAALVGGLGAYLVAAGVQGDAVIGRPIALIGGLAALMVFLLLGVGWRLHRRHGAAIDAVAACDRRMRDDHAEYQRHLSEVNARAAAEHERLRRELAGARARMAGQVEAARHAVAYLISKRLPAAFDGAPVPGPPCDEHLDPRLAELVEQIVQAALQAAERYQDRQDTARDAVKALAQRSQTLAHRIQEEANAMADRHPHDPDVLDGSMRIDHAAMVAARYSQSLSLLCGGWPGQQWTEPLPLVEVVRAASGRIIPYTRIEVAGDPDLGVTARMVEPLIHLVAELLDNATRFSPSATPVKVRVRAVQQGAVVEIDDCGIGLDEFRFDQLRPITSGERVVGLEDLEAYPRIGLAVVGQYVRRYGLHVSLAESVYGGLQVIVRVPPELVESVDAAVPAQALPAGSVSDDRPAEPAAAHPATTGPDDTGGLPRRRSVRGRARPAPARSSGRTPVSAETPEREGDWMSALFDGAAGRYGGEQTTGDDHGEGK